MIKQISAARIKAFLKGALVITLLVCSIESHAGKALIRLPFRMANNLIIVPLSINGSDSLNFILDTGLDVSIVCSRDSVSGPEFTGAKEIMLGGLGGGTPVDAYHSVNNMLRIGGLELSGQEFLVLKEDVLQLSLKMGTRIQGILSLQVFRDFIVEINYDRRLLLVYSPADFKFPKTRKSALLPMSMEKGRPFLEATVTDGRGNAHRVKLLMDSGASNPLWLDAPSIPGFSIPRNSRRSYLGYGISGDVRGLMGRVGEISIGPYTLTDVPVSFPDSATVALQERVPGRNGSLGANLLMRFNTVLDYPGKQVFLSPARSFRRKFHSDMSGLEVLAPEPDRPVFVIARVRSGSAAELAGIRPGDRILRINNIPAFRCSLDAIYRNLTGREGKKVRMILLRNDQRLKLSLTLTEFI